MDDPFVIRYQDGSEVHIDPEIVRRTFDPTEEEKAEDLDAKDLLLAALAKTYKNLGIEGITIMDSSED